MVQTYHSEELQPAPTAMRDFLALSMESLSSIKLGMNIAKNQVQ